MSLNALRRAAAGCQGCDLYKNATQTVFGEGPVKAAMMLVGEIPGDQEDKQGRPFVGPAGRLLDRALQAASLDRETVYLTNAVKHFKWEERGKRRLHKKPRRLEIVSCRAWLDAEILVVQPQVIVCLGATAAQALIGPEFRVSRQGGQLLRGSQAPWILATLHPSAILRAPDAASRDQMEAQLVENLKLAAGALAAP
jgi:DNA polymerase